MKKCNLFFLMLLACMLLASCAGGSDEAKMTGKGIFGVYPQYLLKYVELNNQCYDELEFEDDKSKQREIIDKYQGQWDDYFGEIDFWKKELDMAGQKVEIVAPEKYGLQKESLNGEEMKLRIHQTYIPPRMKMKLTYDERPASEWCFFLDENDSIIFQTRIECDLSHNAKIVVHINNLATRKPRYRDLLKYTLYSLDKAVKIKVPAPDEVEACLASYLRNADRFVKSLREAGVIGNYSSLDEMVNGTDESKGEESSEKVEEVDQNKPGAADLAYFELRGPVKSYTEYSNGEKVHSNGFSENGKWTIGDGNKCSKILTDVKRDAEKRIAGYQAEENFCYNTYTITYDANTGWVSKVALSGSEGDNISTYFYDEKGYLVKKVIDGSYTEMGADEAEKVHDTITYKYETFDQYGNWTKRTAKYSDGTTTVEKRDVVYYK